MQLGIITALAVGGLATIIVAPASAAPRVPVSPPTPVFNWTGFYVGGTAGGAWGSFNPSSSTAMVPVGELSAADVQAINAAGSQSIRPDGFTGGFEAGYNWQPSNFLFGLEGDIEAFHLSGSASSGPMLYHGGAGTFTVTSNASADWLATARGRLGYVAGNWLFYATGGAAFTDLHGSFSFSETAFGGAEAASLSSSKTGYAVGGGVEASLSRQWSLKAEYLFVDFGTVSASGTAAGGVLVPTYPFTHTMDLKANIARLGLNYHF
ncbi:MAG: outer membrane beta-barrel protein [Xanthobacteraceae bacterium]